VIGLLGELPPEQLSRIDEKAPSAWSSGMGTKNSCTAGELAAHEASGKPTPETTSNDAATSRRKTCLLTLPVIFC
jgi:hypothetical protein